MSTLQEEELLKDDCIDKDDNERLYRVAETKEKEKHYCLAMGRWDISNQEGRIEVECEKGEETAGS